MSRARLNQYDVVIAKLAAESASAAEAARRFVSLAAGEQWRDVPSERTVRRRALEFQKRLAQSIKVRNRPFGWPESMMSGALPSEASRAALDLLKHRSENGLDLPTNREARFFWRIRQASPAIEDRRASTFAGLLAAVEFYLEIDETAVVHFEWIQSALAYQPWLSPEAATVYERAIYRGLDPIEANPIPAETRYTFEAFARSFADYVVVRSERDEERADEQAW
jgi:hypothetical protein